MNQIAAGTARGDARPPRLIMADRAFVDSGKMADGQAVIIHDEYGLAGGLLAGSLVGAGVERAGDVEAAGEVIGWE